MKAARRITLSRGAFTGNPRISIRHDTGVEKYELTAQQAMELAQDLDQLTAGMD